MARAKTEQLNSAYNMSKNNAPSLPGIDLQSEGLRHQKRERMKTKEQVSSYVDRAIRIVGGEVRLPPGEFHTIIQEVFDSAYSIGLTEGTKLREWNERMTP